MDGETFFLSMDGSEDGSLDGPSSCRRANLNIFGPFGDGTGGEVGELAGAGGESWRLATILFLFGERKARGAQVADSVVAAL